MIPEVIDSSTVVQTTPRRLLRSLHKNQRLNQRFSQMKSPLASDPYGIRSFEGSSVRYNAEPVARADDPHYWYSLSKNRTGAA